MTVTLLLNKYKGLDRVASLLNNLYGNKKKFHIHFTILYSPSLEIIKAGTKNKILKFYYLFQ